MWNTLLSLCFGYDNDRQPPPSHRQITNLNSPGDPTYECELLHRYPTASTYLIVQVNDKYHEEPFIYVIVYPTVVVVIDTGCGSEAFEDTNASNLWNDKDEKNHSSTRIYGRVTDLREWIERVPVESNGSQPLNPNGQKPYWVICTHCHYDHIGGIESFTNSPGSIISASSHDRAFLDPSVLPKHSICHHVGMRTPEYKITHWLSHLERLAHPSLSTSKTPLNLQVLHTPGHTPDELALYDSVARVLFVGDTLYEHSPIEFDIHGNLTDYMRTLETLEIFVNEKNRGFPDERRVTLAAGHATARGDAARIIGIVQTFLRDILAGEVEEARRWEKRGRKWVEYERGTFSVLCPLKIVQDARHREGGNTTI